MKNEPLKICNATIQPGEISSLALPMPEIFNYTPMYMPLFGFLIESAGKENAIVYQQQDFTKGLVILLCSYILAFLLSLFFVKETYCRQQSEPVWLDKTKKER